jgi:magnesium transporter
MGKNVIWVREDTDQEEVAKIAADYDIAAVPVVDSKKRLVGIVTVDDVIDVIQEEAAEDLGFLAGTGKRLDKLIEAPTWTVAKYRLPWLIFALIGNGIVAAYVLKIFEQTLASVIALALFIPVIMTMGGNVGVQSSTIFVRGIATGDIRDAWNYFFRELRIGLMIALVICVGITIAAYILVKRPILGMIVGTSMFLTIILASTIGVIIPKILDWIGVDPAVASNPFITTFQDIMSLFVYFGLATLMLHYLI